MNLFLFFFVAFSLESFSSGQFTEINNELLEADKNQDEIPDIESRISFKLLFPGTKWCGTSNNADGYDDLGKFEAPDKCCRDHDLCPDVIHGWHTEHNLTNPVLYTRLNCTCDEALRNCLHDSNHPVGDIIGKFYFNALHTQCFREDYPVTGCKREEGLLIKKCLEYTYDESGEKRYQWFDVPKY